jgi:hypothetical protein
MPPPVSRHAAIHCTGHHVNNTLYLPTFKNPNTPRSLRLLQSNSILDPSSPLHHESEAHFVYMQVKVSFLL